MEIKSLIQKIEGTLTGVFGQVDQWFDKEEALKHYRPSSNGWTISEVLEHIALTSHFLLKLIDKGAAKALKNIHQLDLETELRDYRFEETKLDEIGIHKSFAWMRPEHMEPTGQKSEVEVRQEIKSQLKRCLNHLKSMPDGQGVLYKTTMVVNDLGKIDVYEYLYFLAKHAERHLAQMQRNEAEYLNQ